LLSKQKYFSQANGLGGFCQFRNYSSTELVLVILPANTNKLKSGYTYTVKVLGKRVLSGVGENLYPFPCEVVELLG
jgi:hypothetical protein